MIRDPIVEEVRATRRRLLQAAGGTLDGLYNWLKRAVAMASFTPRFHDHPRDHRRPDGDRAGAGVHGFG